MSRTAVFRNHLAFRDRTVGYAALTVNALRPLTGIRGGVASFFAGGLTLELAPQWLAVTVTDAAVHLVRARRPGRRRDPVGLALAAVSTAGLAYAIAQSRADRQVAEQALEDALGVEYAAELDHLPTPAELATPWRSLVRPLRSMKRANLEIRVERDIAYGEAGRRNFLDVYRPAEIEGQPLTGAPVLLQIHGGAWMFGSKNQQGLPLMQHLARQGWVCVAINYRLAPRNPWPAQIVDVKHAIAWIREHIEAYGGDPGYLAITGGSAGGHLTALAALTPNDPAYQPGFEDADTHVEVAVPHYGVYDLAGATGTKAATQLRDLFLSRRIFRRPFSDDPETFRQASPMLRISDAPPDSEIPDFFVVHGGRDSLVPVDQARQFVRRLREQPGRTTVYAELPGAQHAFDVLPSIRSEHVVRAIDRYLHWHRQQHLRQRDADRG